MAQHATTLEALRARIQEIEGARVEIRRRRCGVPAIDELVGGIPAPGVMEVHGTLGGGRVRLALEVVRQVAALGARVAWVDSQRRFNPAAAADLGVPLSSLLLVRPPADRRHWATEQLARAGCLPLVVVADPQRVGRAGQRWARAAESGGSTVLVLSERPERDVPAQVRLQVSGGEVAVVRARGATTGRRQLLDDCPPEGDPWGLGGPEEWEVVGPWVWGADGGPVVSRGGRATGRRRAYR